MSNQPAGFFLRINDHGKERRVRLYSTTSDWSRDVIISEDEKTVSIIGNQQLRFTTLDNKEYIYHSLLDKRVSYTVDLSQVKKSWNCALYTCDFSNLTVPGYLDAQTWDSRVEMDYQEANRISFHYTAHCSGDRSGHLIMGLGGSVQQNPSQKFRSDTGKPAEQLYGPGQFIDTGKPFRVVVEHTKEKVRLELHQEGKMIYNEATDEHYISKCHLDKSCHTFIMSLWTGWMDWLDGGLPWYQDSHIHEIKATISDFTIEDMKQVEVKVVNTERCSCVCPGCLYHRN